MQRRLAVAPNEAGVDVGAGVHERGDRRNCVWVVTRPIRGDVQQRSFVVAAAARPDPRAYQLGLVGEQPPQGGSVAAADRRAHGDRQRTVLGEPHGNASA